MINALSFDLEYWYSAEYVSRHISDQDKHADQIVQPVAQILRLLDKYNAKATFFVLGELAQKHPQVVKEIFCKGHEIASHGYSHKFLGALGPEQFADQTAKTCQILRSITGQNPIGFRAPNFSVDQSTDWAFRILKEHGFRYDSSVFPLKTILYGVNNAPVSPYSLSLADFTKPVPDGDIIEFPISVLKTRFKNIPFAGGFYFRALPAWFLKIAIKKINQTRPAVIYLHPWELYRHTPQINSIPRFHRFITYFRINSALGKLESLLRAFKFGPLREVLHLN
ncbi:MAG: DUF3473 domain-containing protein [Chloroflexi bacterium]|nr:DUF3473 domain-containing protein [Chloroflexota bacterium]MBT7289868.1 DUF3473 domain-containing protein [Chloroflexota bacterium]